MTNSRMLVLSLAALLLVACSDWSFEGVRSKFINVDEFLIEAKGHWVHNELYCDNKLQSYGVHDMHLSELGIKVSPHSSEGDWAAVENPDVYFDVIREFANNCEKITRPYLYLAFFRLNTPGFSRVIAVGDEHLFSIEEDGAMYHYTLFEKGMFEGYALVPDSRMHISQDDIFTERDDSVSERFVIEVD